MYDRYYDTQQRFPHLVNALKYAVAHTVVIAGVFHPNFAKNGTEWSFGRYLWFISTISSTIFTFTWDCTMDWGLWDVNHGLLRKTLLFRDKRIYYWAMLSNLFLRYFLPNFD